MGTTDEQHQWLEEQSRKKWEQEEANRKDKEAKEARQREQEEKERKQNGGEKKSGGWWVIAATGLGAGALASGQPKEIASSGGSIDGKTNQSASWGEVIEAQNNKHSGTFRG